MRMVFPRILELVLFIIIGSFLLASPVSVAQVVDIQTATQSPEPNLVRVPLPKTKKLQPRVWRVLGYGAGQIAVGDVSGDVENAISTGGALALGVSLTAPQLFDVEKADEAELQVFVRRGTSTEAALSSRRGFGRALLSPESVSTGFRLVGSWSGGRLVPESPAFLRDFGLQATIDIGASSWSIADPEDPAVDPQAVEAVSGVASTQLIWRTRSPVKAENSFAFVAGIGPSVRWLGDSIANTPELRQRALGTTDSRFWGVDSFFTIQFNQIGITPRVTYVFGKNHVEGLSGFQFFLTTSLLGGLSFAEPSPQ